MLIVQRNIKEIIMYEDYVKNLTLLVNQIQQPMQELMELNARTWQNFTYLKPEELTQVRKPDELFKKQMESMIANSHRTLDYMLQSFQIFENALESVSAEATLRSKEFMTQTQDTIRSVSRKTKRGFKK